MTLMSTWATPTAPPQPPENATRVRITGVDESLRGQVLTLGGGRLLGEAQPIPAGGEKPTVIWRPPKQRIRPRSRAFRRRARPRGEDNEQPGRTDHRGL